MPEARPAISRAACALVGCLLIVGCGGGGGGGGETNQPAGAPPPQTANPPVSQSASVQFSATALTLTGDTARNVNPIDSTIQVTLQNRPSNGVWTRATSADPALYSANVNWSSETEGRLQVVPRTPRSLGAGTYNVTLQVEVCSDAQCASQIAGSPVSIAVTYVVTGSAYAAVASHLEHGAIEWHAVSHQPNHVPGTQHASIGAGSACFRAIRAAPPVGGE